MLKKSAFWVLLAFLASASNAAPYLSLSAKDKTITQKSIFMLNGSGRFLRFVKANDASLKIANSAFNCALILNPGKNFLKIEALNKRGLYDSRKIRILRLVSFPDVEALYDNEPHWAKHEIVALSTLGIIEGYPDNNYYVNKHLTRGELATWICKAKGIKVKSVSSDPFNDVPKEHWRAPYIKEVVDRNYMKGDEFGDFGIDMPISRAEAAAVALIAEGATFEKELVSVFYDVPKANPHYSQIKEAKAQGLIRGISWKTAIYEPERELTRAEAAILFSRFGRIKWLSKWLYDFKQGYTTYCKIDTAPIVSDLKANPNIIYLNGTSPLRLEAKAADREGEDDIIYVKADISSLGGLDDAEMIKTNTGYSLQFVPSAESYGEKTINVQAVDKYGLKDTASTKVLVVK